MRRKQLGCGVAPAYQCHSETCTLGGASLSWPLRPCSTAPAAPQPKDMVSLPQGTRAWLQGSPREAAAPSLAIKPARMFSDQVPYLRPSDAPTSLSARKCPQ